MLPEHCNLKPDDHCTYMGEYTARKGAAHSGTNQLIMNFKKGPDRRGKPDWGYKAGAIQTVGSSMAHCLRPYAQQLTLVPVPPSKCKTDIAYDDRMIQALAECQCQIPDIDCRELVIQTHSTRASHESGDRLSSDDLIALYTIEDSLINGARGTLLVVDDMLTTGSHYRAMYAVLRARFPGHVIAGLFIARRVLGCDFDPV